MSIRIVLADDHEVVRRGLRAYLESAAGLDVVGEAADGGEAVRLAREHQPDIVIMDVVMPGVNGVEATRRIRSENPEIKIIAFSIHAGRPAVKDMLKAGASGYVLKECGCSEMTRAIQTVQDGQTYLSPRITGLVIEELIGPAPVARRRALTERETEILRRLADGQSMKQIALSLGLSIKTVELCRRQVMQRLGLQSIAGLTKYAIREGLTSLDA